MFRLPTARSRRLVAAMGTAVLAGSLLAACGTSDGDAAEAEVLTIAAQASSPDTNFFKDITQQFTAETGIEVVWQEIPHDNLHERLVTESSSGTGAIDIFQADQPWISEFAELGFLDPLDDRISQEDLAAFSPEALETVSYDGQIYALPYLTHTPVLYYRTDLFEAEGIDAPPTTWEEYRDYAQRLTKDGVYGTLVEGKQAGEPVTHLIDRFLQAGGGVLDDSGQPIIDSAENARALQFMLDVQQESSPPGAVGFDNADAHNMFMQGHVAMVINWPYMYSIANDPASSQVADKFEVALQPEGAEAASAIWSWGYGISASSKQKDTAYRFVQWATNADVLREYGKQFVTPIVRPQAVEDLNNDPDMTDKELRTIETMSESLNYGVNVTTTPAFPAIQERLSVTLSRVMTGQGSPADELAAAQRDIERIVAEQ